MKIKLKCPVVYTSKGIFLLSNNNYGINCSIGDHLSDILIQLEKGIAYSDIQTLLKDDQFADIFFKLKDKNLLICTTDSYQGTSLEKSYDFFNFHFANFDTSFSFLDDIHVAIVGCGGIGCNVAMCLATAGIRKISLVDFDQVQPSNLNCQFAYNLSDIGKSKTKCLQEKLFNINPTLDINIYEKKVSKATDLSPLSTDVKLIVCAIDTPPICASIYCLEYTIQNNMNIIFGSTGYTTIAVGPLLVSHAARCNYLTSLEANLAKKASIVSGSLSSTNLLVCAILGNEIINFFYPFSNNMLLNRKRIYAPISMQVLEEKSYDSD
ncbi:ThiF family adenylyltransferase [Bartonella tribocorum]|uniref:THIF-type NAD/FAD binding fold domain-containing protein n=1 Tax=Bartonella tribocorum TaxID=85701 RepID=A0A2M6UTF7_9HYPH|nr:ThiF family adenylyltransferase [Bartonella tribocorum]PIT69475.1 hypothetical protein CER18_03390 [Bartonella tribocorum]